MVEHSGAMPAKCLMTHDEFSADQGQTWHKVKVWREARRGTRIVVVTTEGRELILKSDDQVLVK